jgi:hypothetical protein
LEILNMANPGPAVTSGSDALYGGNSPDGSQLGTGSGAVSLGTGAGAVNIATATGTVGFYGIAAVGQRASTSVQRTSNLATTTTTPTSAQFNQAIVSLSEVMNTLAAYGLWSIS